MDSGGHLYRISASEDQKKFMDNLRSLTPGRARELKLTEVNRPLTPYERKTAKIGRNSQCGCGSGKKFKRCCYGK